MSLLLSYNNRIIDSFENGETIIVSLLITLDDALYGISPIAREDDQLSLPAPILRFIVIKGKAGNRFPDELAYEEP